MTIEDLNPKETKQREAMLKSLNSEIKKIEQLKGSIENLSDKKTEQQEAMLKSINSEIKKIEQLKGSIENLSNKQTEQQEAMIKAIRNETRNIEQLIGPTESLGNKPTEQLEAMLKAIRNEVRPIEELYGSLEHADDTTLEVLAANVAEKRKQNIPHKEYFNKLINNLEINDQTEFNEAVVGTMQSNDIMLDFVDKICNKVREKIFELNSTDKNDNNSIQNAKQEIEKIVAVYQKYMYTLKDYQWDFKNSYDLGIPEDITKKLTEQEQRLGIGFNMPIPEDLGEYYGGKFERNCKMVPGIKLMNLNLKGEKINWHSVINYEKGELTPKQRYEQNLIAKIQKNREILYNKQEKLTELRKTERSGGELGG